MVLLAVETTCEPGSLAVLRAGSVLELVSLPPGRYSTTLHGEIGRLLARFQLVIRDVDAYAVSTGPGAFTAVRMGLAAVKGLAEACQKPVVGVSTLQSVAAAAWNFLPPGSPCVLVPILDARRGQVFAAAYRGQGGALEVVLGDTVCALGAFLERLRSAELENLHFCGPAADPFLPQLEKAGWRSPSFVPVSPLLAGTLAAMAWKKWQTGEGVPAMGVDANYVRPSDAELFWKE